MFAKKHNTKIIFDIIMGSCEEFDLCERLIEQGRSDKQSANAWIQEGASMVVMKHGMKLSNVYTVDSFDFSIKPFPVKSRKGFGGGDGYASCFLYGIYQG